eukprot:1545637-Amphidinium_carterae.2
MYNVYRHCSDDKQAPEKNRELLLVASLGNRLVKGRSEVGSPLDCSTPFGSTRRGEMTSGDEIIPRAWSTLIGIPCQACLSCACNRSCSCSRSLSAALGKSTKVSLILGNRYLATSMLAESGSVE